MITSSQNQTIKDILKITKKKDIVCLDSPNLIDEGKKANLTFLYVLKLESCTYSVDENDIIVSENVFNKFTNSVSSQGIVGIAKLVARQVEVPQGNFLVMENVQDPGNVGTLIRSAVGADFLDIYLINCAKVTSSKVLRSTVGAFFKARMFEVGEEFYNTLKNWNQNIIIADMDGKNLYQTHFEGSVGIVVGNEGQGISNKMKDIASSCICIPMQNDLESLNVGVSGSIIMYEIANKGEIK